LTKASTSAGAYTSCTFEHSVDLNESLLHEREKLIKFIVNYIKKNNEIPPTTLDYYKFVRMIGKGAFGKVILGIHKLTGKYVGIKTIEKAYMQDDYSRRKVF
jgi:serine/threonine protein kinase